MDGKRSYLCLNYASTYKFGQLLLPSSFCIDHGDELPNKVYMHMPNSDIWRGRYVKRSTFIEGLEKLMVFYSVKPYHLILIHYLGGPDFDLEIFNPYAVEIAYPPKRVVTHQGSIRINNVDSVGNAISEVEVDKLCASLRFNALNKSREVYRFVIEKSHLEGAEDYQVLAKEGCYQMGLEEQMNWIDLSFEKFKWRVTLKWDDGNVFFGQKWHSFTKAARLCEGDTVVVEHRNHYQKFRVSVFEVKNVSSYNNAGIQQGKSMMKFFKIVKSTKNDDLILEVPKVFVDKYGKRLRKDVRLFVADGKKYCVKYCSENRVLWNMKKVLKKYSVQKNYVLFFDYVGNSSFYLSIFSSWCYDICNQIKNKLVLSDIIGRVGEELIEPKMEDVLELSDSSENVKGPMEEDTGDENAIEDLVQRNGNTGELVERGLKAGRENFSFTIKLMKSHVDQQGHGVYLPRHLLSVYRPWKKSTVVFLLYRGKEWRVSLLRNKKICRFGLGWNNFTGDNKFKAGRKLIFNYGGNLKFKVTYVAG